MTCLCCRGSVLGKYLWQWLRRSEKITKNGIWRIIIFLKNDIYWFLNCTLFYLRFSINILLMFMGSFDMLKFISIFLKRNKHSCKHLAEHHLHECPRKTGPCGTGFPPSKFASAAQTSWTWNVFKYEHAHVRQATSILQAVSH